MVSMNRLGLPPLVALGRTARFIKTAMARVFSTAHRVSYDMYRVSEVPAIAGVHHMRAKGPDDNVSNDNVSVVAFGRQCSTPMYAPPLSGCDMMRLFSSAQTARQASDTWRALGTTDLTFACGAGVTGHPDGIAARARSVRDAPHAAVEGARLAEFTRQDRELATALRKLT